MMKNLKSAVTILLDKGKIVTPEALEVLQQVKDPVELVNQLLNIFPAEEHITGKMCKDLSFKKTATPTPVKKSRTKPTRSPKIPRRTLSKLSHKPTVEPRSNQSELKTQSEMRSVIGTKYDDLVGLHNYESDLKIITNPDLSKPLSSTIDDKIGYFQSRFERLARLFRSRNDIRDLVPIKDVRGNDKNVAVIGMVYDKYFSPNGGARITIDDPQSDRMLEVIIPSSNTVLVEECQRLMYDSVICVLGFLKFGKLIANEVLLPDLPKYHNHRRADVPVHVAYLSDIHIGSKNFLPEPMEQFIDFLNGEYGNTKLQALGEQTKYVLFGGDVVDGVGIYPNQLDDLEIDSISDQYDVFAQFVERIPEDVEVIVIPGNHDMVRSAEPQPSIDPIYAPSLSSFDNVHLLPNPSQVALHGVQVLMYHCTSLPDITNHIPGLPIEQPVEVMKQMLRSRHLAPIWGARTPIAFEPSDHLVIDPIPDIFHGGHIHINGEGSYGGVRIINSGTMQQQTSYQKSLNIVPTPGQVTLTNLKDGSWSKIDFLSK